MSLVSKVAVFSELSGHCSLLLSVFIVTVKPLHSYEIEQKLDVWTEIAPPPTCRGNQHKLGYFFIGAITFVFPLNLNHIIHCS